MSHHKPPVTLVGDASRPRPRRRWLRFSLRSLLILVTILCVWLGIKVNQARRQKEAVAAFRELGAIVYYAHQRSDTNPRVFSVEKDLDLPGWLRDLTGDDFFQSVVLVQFMGPVTDDTLIHLEALPDIESLTFVYSHTRRNPLMDAGAKITDAGLARLPRPDRLARFSGNNMQIGDGFLKRLSNSSHLEVLVLGDTNVTEHGLGALRKLTELRVLSITDPQLGDAALARLPDMPSLEILQLTSWQVTNAGLAHLARHKNLSNVYLGDTSISDAGLRQLAALPTLEGLNLERTKVRGSGLADIAPRLSGSLILKGTSIDDASLMYLKEAQNLQALDLEETAITDAGLAHLHGLPKLSAICLEGTQVTKEGITQLTKALPTLAIVSKPKGT